VRHTHSACASQHTCAAACSAPQAHTDARNTNQYRARTRSRTARCPKAAQACGWPISAPIRCSHVCVCSAAAAMPHTCAPSTCTHRLQRAPGAQCRQRGTPSHVVSETHTQRVRQPTHVRSSMQRPAGTHRCTQHQSVPCTHAQPHSALPQSCTSLRLAHLCTDPLQPCVRVLGCRRHAAHVCTIHMHSPPAARPRCTVPPAWDAQPCSQ